MKDLIYYFYNTNTQTLSSQSYGQQEYTITMYMYGNIMESTCIVLQIWYVPLP